MSSGPRILPVRISVAGKSLRFHFLIQIRFGFHGLITMSNNHDRSEDEPIEAILVSPPAGNTSLVDRLGQQSRFTVLLILFTVTGCLGLPLLWFNPRFSVVERIAWSLIVTFYTALLCWIVVSICVWAYQRISF